MSSNNGHGKNRIHLLGEAAAKPGKTDDKGRVLLHNATIEEVYQIVAEECAKVHEFYLAQIPPHVARMIQDALMSFGLIKLLPEVQAALDIAPVEATVVGPESPETRESIATLPAAHDTIAPPEPDA